MILIDKIYNLLLNTFFTSWTCHFFAIKILKQGTLWSFLIVFKSIILYIVGTTYITYFIYITHFCHKFCWCDQQEQNQQKLMWQLGHKLLYGLEYIYNIHIWTFSNLIYPFKVLLLVNFSQTITRKEMAKSKFFCFILNAVILNCFSKSFAWLKYYQARGW